jgi:hypothetical protein
LGFKKGPNIKEMMQLITSARWGEPRMGPFVARSAGEVFETQVYDHLIKTEPEEVYRMYLMAINIWFAYNSLRASSAPLYYEELKGYVDMVLFAAIWPLINSAQGSRTPLKLTEILQSNVDERTKNTKLWERLVRVTIKHAHEHFQKTAKQYRKEQRKNLTVANYFKNTGNSQALYNTMPPKGAINVMKAILREG